MPAELHFPCHANGSSLLQLVIKLKGNCFMKPYCKLDNVKRDHAAAEMATARLQQDKIATWHAVSINEITAAPIALLSATRFLCRWSGSAAGQSQPGPSVSGSCILRVSSAANFGATRHRITLMVGSYLSGPMLHSASPVKPGSAGPWGRSPPLSNT